MSCLLSNLYIVYIYEYLSNLRIGVLSYMHECDWCIVQNALLEFAKVLKAKEQVVAGTIYLLTLEVIDAGKKKVYEAKVWVKPWMNFKQLQEFKQANDVPSFSQSDLGAERGNWLLQSVSKFLLHLLGDYFFFPPCNYMWVSIMDMTWLYDIDIGISNVSNALIFRV